MYPHGNKFDTSWERKSIPFITRILSLNPPPLFRTSRRGWGWNFVNRVNQFWKFLKVSNSKKRILYLESKHFSLGTVVSHLAILFDRVVKFIPPNCDYVQWNACDSKRVNKITRIATNGRDLDLAGFVDRVNKSDRSERGFAAFQFSCPRAICISGKRTHISAQSRPLWRINRAVHLTFAEERATILPSPRYSCHRAVESSRHSVYFFFWKFERILENNKSCVTSTIVVDSEGRLIGKLLFLLGSRNC